MADSPPGSWLSLQNGMMVPQHDTDFLPTQCSGTPATHPAEKKESTDLELRLHQVGAQLLAGLVVCAGKCGGRPGQGGCTRERA